MPEREPRESDDDPCFPQPTEQERQVPLWRYMDLCKFESLLEKGLHFSRLDRLGDAWEGAMPVGTQAILENYLEASDEVKPYAADARAGWKLDYESLQKETFVSCWQLSKVELWWMWKVYCKSDKGVAIRTTYERLDAWLPPSYQYDCYPLLIGKVQYGPYESHDYSTPLGQRMGLAMSKRDCFQDEREVRVLFDHAAGGRDKTGVFVEEVDLNQLVTSIVVSPVAPKSFRDEVEALVRAAGYQIPVEQSPIRNEPRPLFRSADRT